MNNKKIIETVKEQAACFKSVYEITGRYVNDHCFIQGKDGTVHLFHIVGPIGDGCYDAGSEISFGHAVSKDLVKWDTKPDCISIDPDSVYEPHHIFAPYVCEKEGMYFMFYSGINSENKTESMCLAVSDDLYNWSKHVSNPVFRPSRSWAEYNPFSGIWGCCRDPHILSHPKHGYILYYTTWMKGTKSYVAALGAAISENLVSWQDVGPVMIRERAVGHSTTSMESPCVIEKGGRFFLFYKHRDETRVVVSDDPLHFTDKEDVWFSIAHAAEIFLISNKWYISSCSHELQDMYNEHSDRTKGLYLASLDWSGDTPRIVPFEAPVIF